MELRYQGNRQSKKYIVGQIISNVLFINNIVLQLRNDLLLLQLAKWIGNLLSDYFFSFLFFPYQNDFFFFFWIMWMTPN